MYSEEFDRGIARLTKLVALAYEVHEYEVCIELGYTSISEGTRPRVSVTTPKTTSLSEVGASYGHAIDNLCTKLTTHLHRRVRDIVAGVGQPPTEFGAPFRT